MAFLKRMAVELVPVMSDILPRRGAFFGQRLIVCGACRHASHPTRSYSTSPSAEPMPPSRVIFSGIQPTGTPHLGNYAGAIRPWVALQRSSSPAGSSSGDNTLLYFSIVDLHALTLPQPPGQLAQRRRELLAALLACGLRAEQCSIFYQSSVRGQTWSLEREAAQRRKEPRQA